MGGVSSSLWRLFLSDKPKILIVDSSSEKYTIYEDVLSAQYSLTFLDLGQTALRLFDSADCLFRVVVVNVNLDDMSGVEVLKKIKQLNLIPEVILVSGLEDVQIAVDAMKSGAFDFILEPLRRESLILSIEKALESSYFVARLAKVGESSNLSQLEAKKRMNLVHELIFKRRREGRALTAEEILVLFSEHSDAARDYLVTQFQGEFQSVLSRQAKATVLIIEDDFTFREDLVEILSDTYTILSAETGREAIDLIKKNPQIELALLDIYLPDITGNKLLPKIKELHSSLPVVIMTAYREVDIAVETLREGALDYVNKPFYKMDILNTISKALQKKYLMQDLPAIKEFSLPQDKVERIRLNLLGEIGQNRIYEGKSVLMSDIYAFYPELKRSCIPEEVVLPGSVLKQGLHAFVIKLKGQHLASVQSV